MYARGLGFVLSCAMFVDSSIAIRIPIPGVAVGRVCISFRLLPHSLTIPS